MERKPLVWWPLAAIGGVVAVLVAVVVFATYIGHNYGKPDQPTPAQHQQYVQDRAICEQIATRQLPPQFVVGGPQWAKIVNQCLVDRGDG